MRHMLRKFWAALSFIWISTASTLCAYAAEQGTEAPGGPPGLLSTMDVLQKVCLVIVMIVVVFIFGFYIAKLVLKKMHVPPEDKKPDGE